MPRHPSACVRTAAIILLAVPASAIAQGGYLRPPDPIPAIVTAAPTPTVMVGRDRQTLAMLVRDAMPSIADLAEPELRIAGYRINPRTNGVTLTRVAYSTGLSFHDLASGRERPVALPAGARISYPQWSPDGRSLAFVNSAATGLELWVADVGTAEARRVTDPVLNGTLGAPFRWLPDNTGFLVMRVDPARGSPPERSAVPTGPIIQENLGRTAPSRTYQDLLTGPEDERQFDYYFTSQLATVARDGGPMQHIGPPGVHLGASLSPDGRYLLVTRARRPWSYVVPARGFPQETLILDRAGSVVKVAATHPASDQLPTSFDAVHKGPRDVSWRADAPATIVWAEAQDGGDPRQEAVVRDKVFMLAAPFSGAPRHLADLDLRFGDVQWARRDLAIVTSSWWRTRREKRLVVDPSDGATRGARVLVDRSYEDSYGDPGDPVFTTTPSGHSIVLLTPDGRGMYVTASGASARGTYPFLDVMDLATGRSRRVWQAADPYFESVVSVLDPAARRILTRRESLTEAPNYFVRTLPANIARAVTNFPDPAPQFAGIRREIITYERADGVKLSGTLYLPPGHDVKRDGPLPLLMWAYPTEYRSASAAGQMTDSPNRFVRPGGTSHLFTLLAGYAVLDDPAMPVIGEGDAEPNDRYIEQLVASAKAAVDKVVAMGVTTPDRIAVGGHSYGAFMTANLLAHSDLFRAGIARSGAYNRTLTPFGFQAEERTYWEATDTYTRMSPFTYANKVNEPILLIHGANDDNSGTFPVQSERFYAALKGHGATARYVVLPLEAHGYRAQESTLHTLAEMILWLDRYVKQPARVTAVP